MTTGAFSYLSTDTGNLPMPSAHTLSQKALDEIKASNPEAFMYINWYCEKAFLLETQINALKKPYSQYLSAGPHHAQQVIRRLENLKAAFEEKVLEYRQLLSE
jgi:hypothetical protein